MKIYAPGENPVVLVIGTEERAHSIRSLLKRFLGAIGALAFLSLIVHFFVEGFPFVAQTTAGGQPDPTGWPTGIAFFIGGFVVLLLVFWWKGPRY